MGRPYPPEIVAEAKRLVTSTTLPYRELSRRIGVGSAMLCRWAKEKGWLRPDGAATATHDGPLGSRAERAKARHARLRAHRAKPETARSWPYLKPRPPRRVRQAGRPYRREAIEMVRDLVTGTALPYRTIAMRCGLSIETVGRWRKRFGWARPQPASIGTWSVAPERAGFKRRRREAARRAETLARRWQGLLVSREDMAAAARADALAAEAAAMTGRRRAAKGDHPRTA